MEDYDEEDAPNLADAYVSHQRTIDELDAECDHIKDRLRQLLPYTLDGVKLWTFPNSRVEWCKGRHTTKVDTKILRTALVLAGVKEEIIEDAFKKATTESAGEPSMRVSGLK
jgi:hypothetical protein